MTVVFSDDCQGNNYYNLITIALITIMKFFVWLKLVYNKKV